MLFCPVCGHDKLKKNGFTDADNQLYKCLNPTCGKKTTKPGGLGDLDDSFDKSKVNDHAKKKSERFIITAAQNATPVNKQFFDSLLQYAKHNNAKLIVIPYRYRNPTSIFSDKDQEWWDEAVMPYIVDMRSHLHPKIQLMGDIKIQPTAAKPLSGMDTLTGIESAIFGHPKVQLKTIATAPKETAKILTTTGAVTIPNYTNSKAGKKGQHHHSFSAVVLERANEKFHLRHVTACKDGSFIDLDKEYTPTKVKKAGNAQGLVLGDLHHIFLDDQVENAVFGKKGMVDVLKPENIVFHDIIDSYSISHHHRNNPFVRFVKQQNGVNDIKIEVDNVIKYLKEKRKHAELYLVSSNHHNHISQWLMETDWRQDVTNAEFYLETALYMVQNSVMGKSGVSVPNPFEYWISKEIKDIHFISDKVGKKVGDFELSFHGHEGPNGSRGNLNNLSKIGNKVIIGHSHSPGREEGSISVGICARLDLEYISGPSSWLQSNAVIYANGKSTLLNIIDGDWKK